MRWSSWLTPMVEVHKSSRRAARVDEEKRRGAAERLVGFAYNSVGACLYFCG